MIIKTVSHVNLYGWIEKALKRAERTSPKIKKKRGINESMQRSEFESLTGIRPTLSMYSVIEKEYMASEMDKVTFCHAYELNIDGIAERVQYMADMAEINQKQESENRIAELQTQLDKELKWTLSEAVGTNINQEDYRDLTTGVPVSYYLTKEEAVQLLSSMFGFMPERINIRHEVQTFEINKYGQFRVKETYHRDAIYDSSELNYIRFDCAGNQWELVNGELLPYHD